MHSFETIIFTLIHSFKLTLISLTFSHFSLPYSLLLLVDRLGRKLFLVLMASFSLVVCCSDVTFLSKLYIWDAFKYISIFTWLLDCLFRRQCMRRIFELIGLKQSICFVFLACTFGFWQLFLTALTRRRESRSEPKEQFPICSQCFHKRQACGETLIIVFHEPINKAATKNVHNLKWHAENFSTSN